MALIMALSGNGDMVEVGERTGSIGMSEDAAATLWNSNLATVEETRFAGGQVQTSTNS